MKKRVYIETSIASYLAARPARDLIRAARQQLTREWWDSRRGDYDLYVSGIVLDEASEGDPDAARRRLEVLEGIPVLDARDEADELAEALVREGPLPQTAVDDAGHLALATVHGMDFLVTWNCRHLANAEYFEGIATVVQARGYKAPIICTPQELLGEPA